MSRGASCPDEPPIQADQPQTRCTASCLTPIETDGSPARDRQPDVQKRSATPLVYAIPVQLIAYHTAAVMGKDVDQPRSLAKSVTVE